MIMVLVIDVMVIDGDGDVKWMVDMWNGYYRCCIDGVQQVLWIL